MSSTPEKITSIDITHDNHVVAVRNSRLDFVSNAVLSPGYTVRFKNNTPMKPRHAMFHDAGKKMLITTGSQPNTLVSVDAETGKNICERSFMAHGKEIAQPIESVICSQKFSQHEQSNVLDLVCKHVNSLFGVNWDMREDKPTEIVPLDSKYISRHSNFTGVVASSQGHLAVADDQGAIRLFNSPMKTALKRFPKRSKNTLSQLSDPIRHVDISSDGKWIVWTTKDYLAVIHTVFENKQGKETSGFQSPMGDKKPNALILRVDPDDLAKHNITELDLNNGKFDTAPYLNYNTSQAIIEEEIVASTGNYLLRWRLRHIKLEYHKPRGRPSFLRPMFYKCPGTIVDKQFKYGGKREVVTALEYELSNLELDQDDE